MKTTSKILIITLSLLLAFSIVFMVVLKINSVIIPPVEGSGNVVSQEFPIENFERLVVSGNCKVFLSQGDSASFTIRADDNLVELVGITEEKGKLDLFMKGRISKESTLELHLTVVDFNTLIVSRGSRVTSPHVLELDLLNLVVSSGANVSLNLENQSVTVKTSSGSQAELAGKTNILSITCSSGSSVNGSDLKAENVTVRSSSGASAKVWATSSVTVEASSGSSVIYSGNPTSVIEKTSSGASIKSQK
jgi:hypothetical protein